jgi:tagatose-1,6-bisphosphate aldolase non-catalytic subunit AgaZ/GatZ
MSPAVVNGALRAAANADAPVVFVASRNQVESDELGGGYVAGWDQARLGAFVRTAALRWPTVQYYIERDHGGPWQRDDEYRARLPWAQARERALRSLERDLKAGFHCLHIDVSKDPHRNDDVPTELGIQRVTDFVAAVQAMRTRTGPEDVAYEVSVQHSDGGTSRPEEFREFIEGLADSLRRRGLPNPLFVVGNTGTLTKMGRNVGTLQLDAAASLARVAHKNGMVFKEHNADYLPTEALALHAEVGIGMANVAPEFGHVETMALLRLADLEIRSGARRPSNFRDVLHRHVAGSRRWLKWLSAQGQASAEEALPQAVEACGHYFFAVGEVREARRALLANCRAAEISLDPGREVENDVAAAVSRYLNAFASRTAPG